MSLKGSKSWGVAEMLIAMCVNGGFKRHALPSSDDQAMTNSKSTCQMQACVLEHAQTSSSQVASALSGMTYIYSALCCTMKKPNHSSLPSPRKSPHPDRGIAKLRVLVLTPKPGQPARLSRKLDPLLREGRMCEKCYPFAIVT